MLCLFCACLFISVGFVWWYTKSCMHKECLLCTVHGVNLSSHSSAFVCWGVFSCVTVWLYSKLIGGLCASACARCGGCACCRGDGWGDRDLPSQAALTHMASEACAPFNCTASSQVMVGGRRGSPTGRCLASQRKMRSTDSAHTKKRSNDSELIDQCLNSQITLQWLFVNKIWVTLFMRCRGVCQAHTGASPP